jgi:pimeloyl-ACP methyl ester carboxylesterase
MAEIRTRQIDANGLSFAIDEAGQGDTFALLLHGFPEARQAWRRQLPALADAGWHVVAPDLRGYGGTSRPEGLDPYRIEHLVDDVAGLFDAFAPKKRILMAHDWGGVIAWQVAIRKRVPLDGLVILNAPHPAVFARVLRSTWRQMFRSWYVAFFQLPWLPESQLTANNGQALARILKGQSPNFSPALLETYRSNVVQPGAATAMINYYRANATALGRTDGTSEKIATPTLLIWGENDVALDIALTYGNEDFVSDLAITRLPGVSHWVQEDAPDQVNALVIEWARGKGLMAP